MQITLEAEKQIIEATYELHSMCLQAVDKVINDEELLRKFEIPEVLWPAIRSSWNQKKPDFMGRFDFAWDGNGEPKMLEYNADTPSVLVESAKPQLNWQKDKHVDDYQANFMDEFMI